MAINVIPCVIIINQHVICTVIDGQHFILIKGTASSCGGILVKISYGSIRQQTDVFPIVNGNWIAKFSVEICPCNSSIAITATCTNNPTCPEAQKDSTIQCITCPVVKITPDVGQCDQMTGKRVVNFVVDVTDMAGNTNVVTEIDFGEGHMSGGTLTTEITNRVYTTSNNYDSPPIRTPLLKIILPEGCPDISVPLIDLHPCPSCPTVDDITISQGDCNNESVRKREYIISVSNRSSVPINAVIDYGDGTPHVPVNNVPARQPILSSHFYLPGQLYVITVRVGNCPPIPKTIETVPGCSTGPGETSPPTDSTDEGGKCLVSRWFFVILSIFAAICLLISLCIPGSGSFFVDLSIGLAAAAGLVLVLWFIFCPQPCGWGYLFAAQISIGTGLGALYFKGCCDWMETVGLILILGGLGFLVAWKNICKKTNCDVAVELSVVIASVTVPVLNWLHNTGCGSADVLAIIATVSGLIVIWVGVCLNRAHQNQSLVKGKKDCGCGSSDSSPKKIDNSEA